MHSRLWNHNQPHRNNLNHLSLVIKSPPEKNIQLCCFRLFVESSDLTDASKSVLWSEYNIWPHKSSLAGTVYTLPLLSSQSTSTQSNHCLCLCICLDCIVWVVFHTGLHLIMIQLLWSSPEECYDLDMIEKVYFHTCNTLFSCLLNWWVHNIPYRNTLIWSPRVVQLIVPRPIILQHRCWDTTHALLVSPTADPD